MAKTPDTFPGITRTEGLRLSDEGNPTVEVGDLVNNAGTVFIRDSLGEFNARQSGALPTPFQAGQFLSSFDGVSLVWVSPITSARNGWLSNAHSQLLVQGLKP